MSFETQLKRLSHRDWRAVAAAWLPALVQLVIPEPGAPPSEGVEEFYPLEEASSQVPAGGEARVTRVQGLHAVVLHEAVYLLHKAANVLVAAHQQVEQGLPTWSIPTAYQSAFFSMEALLMMLGVSVVEINNRTMLVDVWPAVDARASRRARESYVLGSETHLLQVPRVEHYHRWATLKRLLRTLENSPFPGEFVNAIIDIDDKDFARPRNRLHYRTTWKFDDLHAFCSPLEYCRFGASTSLTARLDPSVDDFAVVLASLLFVHASDIVSELAATAPALQTEHDLLTQACDPERMALRAAFEQALGHSWF